MPDSGGTAPQARAVAFDTSQRDLLSSPITVSLAVFALSTRADPLASLHPNPSSTVRASAKDRLLPSATGEDQTNLQQHTITRTRAQQNEAKQSGRGVTRRDAAGSQLCPPGSAADRTSGRHGHPQAARGVHRGAPWSLKSTCRKPWANDICSAVHGLCPRSPSP